MNPQIKENFSLAAKVLTDFSTEDNYHKIQTAADWMIQAVRNNHKIISCGNGGSMSDAMHFAEEMTGRFQKNRPALAAVAISDPAHITCIANDYGYEYIFSRFVESVGTEGDVLLGISTSGNSQNVINAILAAQKRGVKTVALTGKTGGEIAKIADLEIRVAHLGWADRIQEVHIKIIHTLIQLIEQDIYPELCK
ncbi:MAG: D-sedoheptulose 7-phosphate isomerase [Cytophagales bacterium]|nr:D-sedoheptulose 7-phosphate isomerase [Cytophagales bacterium]